MPARLWHATIACLSAVHLLRRRTVTLLWRAVACLRLRAVALLWRAVTLLRRAVASLGELHADSGARRHHSRRQR